MVIKYFENKNLWVNFWKRIRKSVFEETGKRQIVPIHVWSDFSEMDDRYLTNDESLISS